MPVQKRQTNSSVSVNYGKKRNKKITLPPKTIRNVNELIDRKLLAESEQKYKDVLTSVSVPSAAAGGSIIDLTNVVGGSSVTTRIGDELSPSYVGARLHITGNVGASPATTLFRVMIVQWKENDGTSPCNWNTVLQDPNPVGMWGYYHNDFTKDYRVLYDERIDLSNREQNPEWSHTCKIDCNKLGVVQYASGSTTGTNKIFLMMLSDKGPAAAPPTVDVFARLKFTDH